jgi:hypothetical protein
MFVGADRRTAPTPAGSYVRSKNPVHISPLWGESRLLPSTTNIQPLCGCQTLHFSGVSGEMSADGTGPISLTTIQTFSIRLESKSATVMELAQSAALKQCRWRSLMNGGHINNPLFAFDG